MGMFVFEPRRDRLERCRSSKSQSEIIPCSLILGKMERKEAGASAFVELLVAELPKTPQQLRARHLILIARSV